MKKHYLGGTFNVNKNTKTCKNIMDKEIIEKYDVDGSDISVDNDN